MKKLILLFVILLSGVFANAQSLTYSFTDPCTKEVTYFTFPLQQGQSTVIFFLGKQRTFTASDVASGAFGVWINQVYADYRLVMPCSVQSTNIVRNQIITQVIGSTVQSVMGSIMSSVRSEAALNDASSKGKTESDKKSKKGKNGGNNSSNNNSVSGSNSSGDGNSNVGNQDASQNNSGGASKTNESGTGNSGNNGNGSGGTSSGNSTGNGQTSQQTETKGEEVVGTVTMNVDARSDKGDSKGGGGKSSQRNNPIIVSSDLTNAQNLDKSYTGIINIGMSQSSLTGTSSWGITTMTWFNFKQFALSGRYTMIHFAGNGKLKFIHNLNLTGVYTYGNFMGFFGYSGIMNAGKWGVTGLNVSAAATKITEDGNTFISPSFTWFYTRPFSLGQRLTVSPEIYLISTPLVYSSLEKVTVKDRTFSGFIGSGFDYQLTKRFKVNMNYKLNMSTNPEFPILSFFLIGSKINL